MKNKLNSLLIFFVLLSPIISYGQFDVNSFVKQNSSQTNEDFLKNFPYKRYLDN